MNGATIHYKVDLVIQLIDTTTGASVSGSYSIFKKDGRPLNLIRRDGGTYIAVNVGREDFTLGIDTFGYEPCEININYNMLDERMPIQVVFLIPKMNTGSGQAVLSLNGSLDGIESLEGVCVSKQDCSFDRFEEKKGVYTMTVFKPQGILSMEGIFYGLIKDDESYERFEVTEKTGEATIRLKEALKKEPSEYSINSPISRVVFGSVKGDEYCFRIRDNATDLRYLISYVVKGEQRFRLVDFNQPEEIRLV